MQTDRKTPKPLPRPGVPGAAATPAEHHASRSPAVTDAEKNRLAREASREEDA